MHAVAVTDRDSTVVCEQLDSAPASRIDSVTETDVLAVMGPAMELELSTHAGP